MEFTERITYGLEGAEDAYHVRIPVFVEEQGFSAGLEKDEIDARAWHLVLFDGERPVATGRFFEENGSWHIGRVAVLKDYRACGLGRRLMEGMERKLRELGAKEVRLSAQCRAMGFYESLGYQSEGGEYLDEFCPHRDMRKCLL